MDLTASPRYQFTGKVSNVPYKGGRLDFEGKMEAAGTGSALVASIGAEGKLAGRSISAPPDREYRFVNGRFSLRMTPAGAQWNASGLEVQQGGETVTGEAMLQPDGKLEVKLSRGQ
jgi:hypothetical protein